MPKKRFASQYSKPQTTVHPSLSSSSTSSQKQNGPPSVNELIKISRASRTASSPAEQLAASSNTIVPRTLPPQIRHLLSHPETPPPPPRTRDRGLRRVDENGRRLPPGPAAPWSWVEARREAGNRFFPRRAVNAAARGVMGKSGEASLELHHLPGLSVGNVGHEGQERSLQKLCLRTLARYWADLKAYEMNNLAYLPVGLRVALPSYIATYGPVEGISFEGLSHILVPPRDEEVPENEDQDDYDEFNPAEENEKFFRLDLAGSLGRSITLKQLTTLVTVQSRPATVDNGKDVASTPTTDLSWEEAMVIRSPLTPAIPHLTHLSLSSPAINHVSWSRLLAFAEQTPALTHLSLASWPSPRLTPNAAATDMSSPYGRFHYSSTHTYSHSLDADFTESASVLARLATRWYALEYLDLTGCTSWLPALSWPATFQLSAVAWKSGANAMWTNLATLIVRSGVALHETSSLEDIRAWRIGADESQALQAHLRSCGRRGAMTLGKALGSSMRGTWIDVVGDDEGDLEGLWGGNHPRTNAARERRRVAMEHVSAGAAGDGAPGVFHTRSRRTAGEIVPTGNVDWGD